MTPESQRIAIAQECGWIVQYELYPNDSGYPPNTPTKGVPCTPLPDYINDLNAMHEAEKVLKLDIDDILISKVGEYFDILEDLCDRPCFATASQRAEAFLRTLNLWKD